MSFKDLETHKEEFYQAFENILKSDTYSGIVKHRVRSLLSLLEMIDNTLHSNDSYEAKILILSAFAPSFDNDL